MESKSNFYLLAEEQNIGGGGQATIIINDQMENFLREKKDGNNMVLRKKKKIFNGVQVYEINQNGKDFYFDGDKNSNTRMASFSTLSHKSLFRCSICSKLFESDKYLRMHMSLHKYPDHNTVSAFDKNPINNNYQFTEIITNKSEVFMNENKKMKTTILSHNSLIGETMETKMNQKMNSSNQWVCPHCNKVFFQSSNFKNHVRTHSDERPFVCNICSIGFKERYHLKKHVLFKHTNELKETCKVCGKCFKDSTAVRAHERIHSEARPYECGLCGKTFKTSECLWHHENRSKTCGKAYLAKHGSDGTIQLHQIKKQRRSKNNHNIFLLPNKSYNSKPLEPEMTLDTLKGANPLQDQFYLCPPELMEASLTNEEITQMEIENSMKTKDKDERPFKCHLCNSHFKMSIHLKKHQFYRHNKDESHQCSDYGKKVKDSSSLKPHEHTHSLENFFKCQCGKAFRLKETLSDHLNKGICQVNNDNIEYQNYKKQTNNEALHQTNLTLKRQNSSIFTLKTPQTRLASKLEASAQQTSIVENFNLNQDNKEMKASSEEENKSRTITQVTLSNNNLTIPMAIVTPICREQDKNQENSESLKKDVVIRQSTSLSKSNVKLHSFKYKQNPQQNPRNIISVASQDVLQSLVSNDSNLKLPPRTTIILSCGSLPQSWKLQQVKVDSTQNNISSNTSESTLSNESDNSEEIVEGLGFEDQYAIDMLNCEDIDPILSPIDSSGPPKTEGAVYENLEDMLLEGSMFLGESWPLETDTFLSDLKMPDPVAF